MRMFLKNDRLFLKLKKDILTKIKICLLEKSEENKPVLFSFLFQPKFLSGGLINKMEHEIKKAETFEAVVQFLDKHHSLFDENHLSEIYFKVCQFGEIGEEYTKKVEEDEPLYEVCTKILGFSEHSFRHATFKSVINLPRAGSNQKKSAAPQGEEWIEMRNLQP